KENMQPDFKQYQKQIVANARTLAEELMRLGFKVVTGGTDNHLFLLDLTERNIAGQAAEHFPGRANITVNKNTVPFDTRSPSEASGVRIGTPAVTSRGMIEDHMRTVAGWIAEILSSPDPEAAAAAVWPQVIELCRAHPPHPDSA
ncbi:unnamed protein product, partial [marine sediment metagenome]